MRNIWIVLRSEFLRRVTSVWFVVTTLLGPLVLVALGVLPGVIAAFAFEGSEQTVAVIDDTGRLVEPLQAATDRFTFVAVKDGADLARSGVRAGTYDGYLYLPENLIAGEGAAIFHTADGGGISGRATLERLVDRAVQRQRLAEQNASPELLAIIEAEVLMETVKLTDEGQEEDQSLAFSAVGFLMGFIIYLATFVYGGTVMHSVMEEKTSRVVEVMASSVRPFQLLMGKLLGVGAMGLLQMVLWLVLIVVGALALGAGAMLFLNPADFNLPADASNQQLLDAANLTLPAIAPEVIIWFLLFFLGGYFLYASLFAAIGSAVEQQQDAQSLMMPLTFLVIIPVMCIWVVIESPNSMLSTVLTMIPFFSPILMVVRVAVAEVPLWEVLLSYALLVATFVGAVWLSGRIYRVGILMYGKKPSFGELLRWVRYV